MPVIFACLHVSNGLGFLAGLADLAGRSIGGLAGSRADRDSEVVR